MIRTRALLLLLALSLVALPASPALGGDADPAAGPGAFQLAWSWPPDAAGAVLTLLAPDGTVLRKEFEAGAQLSFDPSDVTGEPLADGSFTWELRFAAAVDPLLRERLEAARARGEEAEADRLRELLGRPEPLAPLSGSFRVTSGLWTVPAALVGTAATSSEPRLSERDQVIPDDLIVQGSACVGFDCVNNENFGFDTIRLKENNTRIKFEDTSTGAFPSTDWQLTANDSASGGLNRFSIEDVTSARVPFTVEGGATTDSLYVDSTGRVGFRTSTPVLDLHVSTSNTPGVRLEQTSAGGFTAQTWDIAGNEANFFVRDVTGGSRLPFRIRPGAPTSAIDISASGRVGFGVASPAFKIDAVGSTLADGTLAAAVFSNTQLDGGQFQVRRARGTSAAPAAIQNNDRLGNIVFQGHNGTAFSGNAAVVGASAEENWSAAGQGTRFFINTTPNGSTSPQVRMTIKNDGRVGIGTTVPTDKLEVNGGNIRVTGGSFIDDGTNLNVPDYVFEPGYELLPLESVRDFVRENGHLPNIPNREQIRANGLNLSEFQMRLLEKVEELTLYALAQHDRVEALRTENDELRRRLEALEQR